MSSIGYHRDADGIVTLTLDAPGEPVNTMNAAFQADLAVVVTRLESEREHFDQASSLLEQAESWLGEGSDPGLGQLRERATASFLRRFPREDGGLYDVVDVDHVPGAVDPSFRPNQILAVGGLPIQLLDGERARAVVDGVESRLWTRLGLRSLGLSVACQTGCDALVDRLPAACWCGSCRDDEIR